MSVRLQATMELRQPFRDVKLTRAGRGYVAAANRLRRARSRYQRLKARVRLKALSAAERGGLVRLVGHAWYTHGGATSGMVFDVRNSQFRSLYDREYRVGYEPEVCCLIDLVCSRVRCFADIGSNWGHLALYAASASSLRGQIHCFEPTRLGYDALRSTVEQVGLSERIRCHRVAVSDRVGTARMRVPDFCSGRSNIDDDGEEQVACCTLDELDIPDPELIKIDVEGHEANVLAGGRETICRARPWIIFENWADSSEAELTLAPFSALRSCGYKFYCPVFELNDHGEGYFSAALPTEAGDTVRFGLEPFAPGERFLLPRRLNVFACPSERVGELEEIFEGDRLKEADVSERGSGRAALEEVLG